MSKNIFIGGHAGVFLPRGGSPVAALAHLLIDRKREIMAQQHKMAIINLLMGGPYDAMGGWGRDPQIMSEKNARSIAVDAIFHRNKHPRH